MPADNSHQTETTTVLVADDDPITRQLLKRYLEGKGHTVLVAVDGEQAWEIFENHQPRLVVTDWRMPKLDGLQLCEKIRDFQTAHYTYVLILTSTTEKEAMALGFAAGADDFMTKPFNREELNWRVQSGMRVIQLHSTLEKRIHQLDDARKELEDANQQMKQGLEAAAKTQQSLLPKSPPDDQSIRCSWSYEPSDHLGGDSINIFRLTENKVGFFIADVCGHGLPSALLAVSLHRVLTPVLGQASLLTGDKNVDPLELFSDPGRVLTEVNHRFPMKIENGEYFTAVYGVVDTEKGELRYAGAGHPNPVLVSPNQKISLLATEGFPIGFDDEVVYATQVMPLNAGDRIYVYSDGVVECQNPAGNMFGMERLTEELKNNLDKPIEETVQHLVRERANWEQGQEDDISMILLEFLGSPVKRNRRKTDRKESEPGVTIS